MANVFKNSVTGSAGIGGLVAYTTPPSTVSTVIGVNVSNIVNQNVYVDVIIGDDSKPTTAYLIKGLLILPNSNAVLVGGEQKIVLESNDYITVASSVDNSVDVVVSVLEIS